MEIFNLLKSGGVMMIPLSLLFILSVALIIDKIIFIKKLGSCPKDLRDLIETYDFSWQELEQKLAKITNNNIFKRFFLVIIDNKIRPIWWIESRAQDEARIIEEKLARNNWILDSTVTAAPLLGLLGTLIGMMSSFKLFGANSLINVNGITAGVAEALIATAIGLAVALIALFAFNYLSRKQDHILDEMERLGTRIIDHVRLNNYENK